MTDTEELLARAAKPAARALRLHPLYHGKVQILPKCPVSGLADFAVWYTPGVAAPCTAIQARPELVYEHTNKGNSIAIVSDGSRVLGLGDIGPEAGLPVMEGKALLFKYLGGVDAFPLCLGSRDADEIVRTVRLLEPSFGGFNLEDIAQPKCFRVLDALRATLGVPVWHDDQQGTATVLLAGLGNALAVVGKELRRARIAMIGMGAANVAAYRLLKAAGVDPAGIVACDSKGVLHRSRRDIEAARAEYADKWMVCTETNVDGITGGIAEALRGADACVAFSTSGPGIIPPDAVAAMARDAVVFACANPVPEIWPWEAAAAGARVIATGRGDFPNQLNNSLVFPGMFRGVLDVRARRISDGMALAAATALAARAGGGMGPERILPAMTEPDLAAEIAAAVGVAAQAGGLAAVAMDRDALLDAARRRIGAAQAATALMMREGLIAAPPPE